MSHEEMKEMYELYALGVLEAEERREIDQHLATGCDACRAGVRRASVMNAIVLSFAPEVAAPRRLQKRLLAVAGVESRNWGWLAWAAASACLLVGMSWFSLESHRRNDELAAAHRVLDIVNSPETRAVSFGAGPRGNVFVNPSRGVLLIANNLPRLEAGTTFEMWVIPKGGAPRPAGLFRPADDGTAIHVLPGAVNLDTTGAIAVTVEPAAGSSAPTTQPIIVAPVAGS